MKQDLTELLKGLERDTSFTMSESEQSRMEECLREYISYRPYPKPHRRLPVSSNLFRFAVAGLVLILLSTSTVSYAAERALPGDSLYPIKIHVNENIARALAQSPVARAEVEAELAARRVDELHELAQENRLTPETSASLEDDFIEHVERVAVETEKIHKQDKDGGRNAAKRIADTIDERVQKLDDVDDDGVRAFAERIDEQTKDIREFRSSEKRGRNKNEELRAAEGSKQDEGRDADSGRGKRDEKDERKDDPKED